MATVIVRNASNEKRRRILLMHLEFARQELEIGRALPRPFADALETWGEAKTDEIDRLNAIELMPTVEEDGFKGDARFAEVAKRLNRFRGVDPDERLIRSWWEGARKAARSSSDNPNPKPKARSLFSDDMLNRGKGRPKKGSTK
jgi:hypothetical protein